MVGNSRRRAVRNRRTPEARAGGRSAPTVILTSRAEPSGRRFMQTRFANNWLGSKISPANRLDRPLAVAASSVPPCGLCGPPGGQITTSEALEWAYARQFMLGERLDPSSSYRAMRHALSRLTCGLAGCRDKFRHHRGFRGRVCMLAHRVGGRSALTNLINLKKLEPSPSHTDDTWYKFLESASAGRHSGRRPRNGR